MTGVEAARYQLGDLLIDTGSRQVSRAGVALDLGALTFDLLSVLAQEAPNLISYDALGERVWPGRSATLETIAQRASMLRKALGDSATEPRYFEVVRGRGLRIVGSLTLISGTTGARAPGAAREVSLAVLPFSDLSSEADQQYFADGLVDDITTDLAQIPHLLVVSRKSSFTYRDSSEDMTEIASALGVTHLLSGTVRRRGNSLRVNARLTDGRDGGNVWSRRFDREASDLFAIQDDIAEEIVTALDVELVSGEQGRLRRRTLLGAEAREALYKGMYYFYQYERAASAKARRHFQDVIDLEPDSVPGYSWMVQAWSFALVVRWEPPEVAIGKLAEYVQKSLAIDENDAQALIGNAYYLSLSGDLDGAGRFCARAVEAAPYLDEAHSAWGWVLNLNGDPATAVRYLESSVRLCPVQSATQFGVLATAYRNVGRFQDSIDAFEKCIARYPDFVFAYTGMAVSYGMMGDNERARDAVQKALGLDPEYTVQAFVTPNFYRDSTVMDACAEVLRAAGMPEG